MYECTIYWPWISVSFLMQQTDWWKNMWKWTWRNISRIANLKKAGADPRNERSVFDACVRIVMMDKKGVTRRKREMKFHWSSLHQVALMRKANLNLFSFVTNYQKPPALRPPGGLFTRMQTLRGSSTSSLIEKVESCRFLCPSILGPFVEGVTTADSGKVGMQVMGCSFGFEPSCIPLGWLARATAAALAAAAALACSLAFAIAASCSACLFASASVRAIPRGIYARNAVARYQILVVHNFNHTKFK